MTLPLPEEVNNIIHTLEDAGYEAYAVGGCVRDMLIGAIPKDHDITTSALPHEIKKIFKYTIDTGIKHGTVTVLMSGKPFEITTYRLDGKYKDGRHPESVTFTPSLEEDLKRRDFTVNAMAYNEKKGLVDIYGGRKDLQKKIIRCVGDPDRRFDEDALRVLRAVRFSAQLDFEIEDATKDSIIRHSDDLKKISAERIRDELMKILISLNPGRIKDLYTYGITKVILPEFDACMETRQNGKYHIYNVGEHLIKCVESIEADPVLRLTMLLHDIGKPLVRKTDERGDHFKGHQEKGAELSGKIMRRLKFDNESIKKVSTLVYYHDYRPLPDEVDVRFAVNKIGAELFPLYLKVQLADGAGKNPKNYDREISRIDRVRDIYDEIIKRGDCIDLKGLAISGNDLISAGMGPGIKTGRILNELLNQVMYDQSLNNKDKLLQMAERLNEKIDDTGGAR